MKKFFFLGMLFAALFSCGSLFYKKNKSIDPGVRCINLSFKLPVLCSDEKTMCYMEGFDNIFYYDSMVMIQMPTNSFHYNDTVLEKIDTANNFFVYKKKGTEGFFYYAFNPENNQKLPVDSIVSTFLYNFKIYDFFEKDALKLISSRKDSKSGVLEEMYSGKVKYMKDTMFFYFSDRLKDLDFSLSEKLDSVKQLKLFKFKAINDEEVMEDSKMLIPKREVVFEIKEIPVTNPKEIMSYFERYKKDFYK